MTFNTPYPDVLKMGIAEVDSVFKSETMKDLVKKQEAEYKLQTALIDRMDTNIKSIGVLAKIMSRR